ncbi:hypothetical protein KY289_036873 [Solanum tuberosum]|nr:hypothetical protein KY289_036873 [Solanum tuberosum]
MKSKGKLILNGLQLSMTIYRNIAIIVSYKDIEKLNVGHYIQNEKNLQREFWVEQGQTRIRSIGKVVGSTQRKQEWMQRRSKYPKIIGTDNGKKKEETGKDTEDINTDNAFAT